MQRLAGMILVRVAVVKSLKYAVGVKRFMISIICYSQNENNK